MATGRRAGSRKASACTMQCQLHYLAIPLITDTRFPLIMHFAACRGNRRAVYVAKRIGHNACAEPVTYFPTIYPRARS